MLYPLKKSTWATDSENHEPDPSSMPLIWAIVLEPVVLEFSLC